MTSTNFAELEELVEAFSSLPVERVSPSIFEIAGYAHYENVISNILAFLLNPTNEHGLGSLVLDSLLPSSAEGRVSIKDVQVNREYFTDSRGRIDILMTTESHVIVIENKIFHYLNNDLNDYANTAGRSYGNGGKELVKLILGVRREDASGGFVSVTYREFIAKIRQKMGDYVSTESQKWLLYLLDLIASIETYSGGKMKLSATEEFFVKNGEQVERLIEERNRFLDRLSMKVKELVDLLDGRVTRGRTWIYAKRILVHDYVVNGSMIALDMEILPSGWSLKVLGRNRESKSHLRDLMRQHGIESERILVPNERFQILTLPIETSMDVVYDKYVAELNRMERIFAQAQSEGGVPD